MRPILLALIALLAGCETSVVWYETHPEKQVIDVDGRQVSVVARGPGKFDAWGGDDGLKSNYVEIKARQVRAVEIASRCRVTGAEYMPGTGMLQTVVNCS